jgi:phospholipid/cholesterol/gamma-HCH transport system permease protein
LRLTFGGEWVTDELPMLDRALRELKLADAAQAELDASRIRVMDSNGAWLLLRTKRELEQTGSSITSFKIPAAYDPLFDTLERGHNAPPVELPTRYTLAVFLERVGAGTVKSVRQGYAMLSFLGRVTVETVQVFLRPWRELPWPSFINQIEETGINALPIVGLLSFLIGVVIAYQGADVLERYGAQIFTINLLGSSILREIGVLMTAIVVAGRSGSAFTAHIGTMQVNQEIDAMQTMGINIAEALVLPRVLGLLVALPLLTIYSDVMGIIGGAVMCFFVLDITVPIFVRQLQSAIDVSTLMVGLVKAPVFAFLIALVGCYEGLRVQRSAESVGQQTTTAVVESIFLVIVFDAGFSILFSILGI